MEKDFNNYTKSAANNEIDGIRRVVICQGKRLTFTYNLFFIRNQTSAPNMTKNKFRVSHNISFGSMSEEVVGLVYGETYTIAIE